MLYTSSYKSIYSFKSSVLQIMSSVYSEGHQTRPSKSSFEVYRSEGDSLLMKKKYDLAICCYNQVRIPIKAAPTSSPFFLEKALDKKNDDVHCLIRRSTCFSSLGKPERALEDANAALQVEPENHLVSLDLQSH